MNLNLLKALTERLRTESIGDPGWAEAKNVFEYQSKNLEVVTVLKLVRAAQGVHALDILCRSGLFVDMGAICRCVEDSVSEVYFLLETYPEKSSNVEKFLKEFFSKTIDGHLSSKEESVQTKKIHSAVVRSLTGNEQDEHTRVLLANIHKTFSGYTHAGYSHIMEMYGGPATSLSFNVSGIPSQEQKNARMQYVIEAYKSVLSATAHSAHMFGLKKLHGDINAILLSN